MRRGFARRHDRIATGITVVLGATLIVVPALVVVTELAVPMNGPAAPANVTSGWVWTHLILAAVLLVIGVGLLARRLWAYFAAVGLAISALLSSFLTIPDHAVTSFAVMAIKVLEIWALSRELNTATIRMTPVPAPNGVPGGYYP
ncbi:MAG TPA: hypothetical protein VGD84_16500 [Pseudonocardiaceae bacterium]